MNAPLDGLIILSNILDVCSAKKAEERIKFHVDTIYEPLIRLLYDLNTDEQFFKMSSGQKFINLISIIIVGILIEILVPR